MTDSDDTVARHYRELTREEPRAAIDTAILAASRRAVAKPSFSRRWAAPVSIAAVLVLSWGVTLEMQREKPGIESTAPDEHHETLPAPSTRAAKSAPARDAEVAPPAARFAAPQPKVIESQPKARADMAVRPSAQDNAAPSPPPAMRGYTPDSASMNAAPPPALAKESRAPAEKPTPFPEASAPATSPPPDRAAAANRTASSPVAAVLAPAPPSAPSAPASPAASGSVSSLAASESVSSPVGTVNSPPAAPMSSPRPAAPAPAPAAAPAPAPPTAPEPRSVMQSATRASPALKVQAAAGADAAAKSTQGSAILPADIELERIAKLREEGHSADADKALEQFRRDHPAYRIADAMWERVKPR